MGRGQRVLPSTRLSLWLVSGAVLSQQSFQLQFRL